MQRNFLIGSFFSPKPDFGSSLSFWADPVTHPSIIQRAGTWFIKDREQFYHQEFCHCHHTVKFSLGASQNWLFPDFSQKIDFKPWTNHDFGDSWEIFWEFFHRDSPIWQIPARVFPKSPFQAGSIPDKTNTEQKGSHQSSAFSWRLLSDPPDRELSRKIKIFWQGYCWKVILSESGANSNRLLLSWKKNEELMALDLIHLENPHLPRIFQ